MSAKVAPPPPLSAAEVLALLRRCGGQEFRAVILRREGQGKRAVWSDAHPYLLNVRGEVIEATGPSGQTRQLSPERFLEVFGGAVFRPPEATGRLTDLGPLFE